MYIKSWCKDLENSALEQANNLMKLPFAYHHIALMPDAHFGYGMPIGGVLATKGFIVPNAVGVDIGCGIRACKTNIKASNVKINDLKDVISKIRKSIPVGKLSHKEDQEIPVFLENEPVVMFTHVERVGLSIKKTINKARRQVGTLGGGNHFIEIQKDTNDYIWIMIHSGSRNVGFTIANYFNKIAIEINKKWLSDCQEDLSFLTIDSGECFDYLVCMNYAIDMAVFNRKLMMRRCLSSFGIEDQEINSIDLSHNHVVQEHHFGENVWVHRKGATRARKGDACIIPGSQGSNSYIGKGLGNEESFTSCSHGAGRKMSREKARKQLDFEAEKKLLDDLGVIHAIRGKHDLDEAPSAYKDIHEVMKSQRDLVEITEELTPIAVIKG